MRAPSSPQVIVRVQSTQFIILDIDLCLTPNVCKIVSLASAERLMLTLATAVLRATHAARSVRYQEKWRNHHIMFFKRGLII
jgi:hypothetical protein